MNLVFLNYKYCAVCKKNSRQPYDYAAQCFHMTKYTSMEKVMYTEYAYILKNELEIYCHHWIELAITRLCLYILQIFYNFLFRSENKNREQFLIPACTHHLLFWFLWVLPFLYGNLNFVLFLNPLLNLFTLCIQVMLSNI